MSRCNRNDLKGNLLRVVTTRIDYQDIYELSSEAIKAIRKLCLDFDLDEQGYRRLGEQDFELNDPVGFTHLPYEYLKDLNSFVLHNGVDFIVEVNQLFLEITHMVQDQYRGYNQIIDFLKKILEVLYETEKINVKRVAIKKSNQVFMKDYSEFATYFDANLLKLNQFGGIIDWSLPNSQTHSVENFSINQVLVNFVKIFDNGEINKEKLYRLYLEYEAYLTNFNFNRDNIIVKIIELNNVIFQLFERSLTDLAIEKLKNDERIGEDQ